MNEERYISVNSVRTRIKMSDGNETERWVQCFKCSKWRVVPDTLKVDGGSAWECRLNVFSATHNKCSAPQETMPAAPPIGQQRRRTASEETNMMLSEMGLQVVDVDSVEDLFVASDCTCTTCTEMNEAAREWHAMTREEHAVPLVQCIIRAIAATASIAETIEEDKRFCYAPSQQGAPSDPRK